MKKNIENIWIILILLSFFTFLLGYIDLINSVIVAILVLITFIKGQLIINYFMGLKDVQLKFRIIPILWLSIILLLIVVAYYLPINE